MLPIDFKDLKYVSWKQDRDFIEHIIVGACFTVIVLMLVGVL